jgi:hypothetical protein
MAEFESHPWLDAKATSAASAGGTAGFGDFSLTSTPSCNGGGAWLGDREPREATATSVVHPFGQV